MKRAVILISVIFLFFLFLFSGNLLKEELPPPVITHNFIDLDKVEEISKYRSCAGHVVVPQNSNERKRNMKHYFFLKEKFRNTKNGIPIYAPFNSQISGIRSIESNTNDEEISFMRSDESSVFPMRNDWEVTLLHLNVLDEINKGDRVNGGQLVGYAHGNSVDIVYSKNATIPKRIEGWTAPYYALDSAFNHMSDQVFNEYINAGIKSKPDIILTKEQRDTKPCKYRGKAPNLEHPQDRNENWLKLR